MPYPSEHAARIKDPNLFESTSFRRKKIAGSNVEMILGKLKGETTMTVQAYRFPKEKYTAEEAKKWLKENKVEFKSFEAAEEKDHADSFDVIESIEVVNRYDSYSPTDWMATKFEKTPEGYLKGRAIVTNIGVFTYKNADGSTRRELRLPEEVFNYESLDSLKLKPITNDHPDVAVTKDNVKKLSIGSTGSEVTSTTQRYQGGTYTPEEKLTDGVHVAIDIVINDTAGIDSVENGRAALSCGYNCDLEVAKVGAVYMGMPYDYIQRNIRYNHVAIVDAARAGEKAKIRLDSMDSTAVLINENNKGGKESMKKIHLDGVDYDAEAPVIAAYTATKERADKATERADKAEEQIKTLTAEKSAIEAERDTAVAKADGLLKDLEAAKAAELDQAKIDSAVEAKIKLMKTAELAGVEVKDGMKDDDIKVAVIKAVMPTANLDGKDPVYISARFDGAVEILTENQKNNDSVTKIIGSSNLPNRQNEDSVDAARDRYIKKLTVKE